jgi:hypothetical protein
MRRLAVLPLLAAVLAGCGGGGSGSPATPTIQPARIYQLVHFTPTAPVAAGKPTTVSFTIRQPDGTPLTTFRTGAGPHTGVHLIYVRDDLSTIIHHHPPLHGAGGRIVDSAVFPAPGPYRLVIDVYPRSCPDSPTSAPAIPGTPTSVCNFQLFTTVHVAGAYKPRPLPPTTTAQTIGACRFTLSGAGHLVALEAKLVVVHVTCAGKPAAFTPWFGALAHAIFFRRASLDYFHTHICSPGAVGCTSILPGTTKTVTGTSSTPGKLNVGVLVPVSGTWRLFLQCRVNGKILTAPFTLHVR